MTRRRHNMLHHVLPKTGWWRLAVLVAAVLILCSCRAPVSSGPGQAEFPSEPPEPPALPRNGENIQPGQVMPEPCLKPPEPPALPRSAFTGQPGDGYTIPGLSEGQSDPATATVSSSVPWAPPGLRRPWPRDEYLRDGGDRNLATRVSEDWSVRGLDLEDTVAHFDTVDGRRLVQPSNRVHIYAPRFASVRKVYGLFAHEQQLIAAGYNQPVGLAQSDELGVPGTATQQAQANGQIGAKSPVTFLETDRGLGVENSQRLAGFNDGLMPHEDFQVIRLGSFERAEKAQLAQYAEAALAWTHKRAVQIMYNGRNVAISTGDAQAQSTYQYIMPPGNQRMRVVKVASTKTALPGQFVDFTIRFDNVGDQMVGNVTIIDNLTPRLEYVPDSQQCTVGADFITERNEGDSLVLRWEITDPLKVGQGGVIRFRCKVR